MSLNDQTPTALAAAGKFQAASRELSRMSTAEARAEADNIVSALGPPKQGESRSSLQTAIAHDLEAQVQSRADGVPATGQGAAVVAFMDDLLRLSPAPATQLAQLAVLNAGLFLSLRVQGGHWDPSFVQDMLALPGHGNRPPFQSFIGNFASSLSDRQDPLFSAMYVACATHCHPVLEAIPAALMACGTNAAARDGLLEALTSFSEKTDVVGQDIYLTLSFLERSGFEIARALGSGETVLHRIAQSSHRHQTVAQLAAMEAGCDPAVRNSRSWKPASCIKDPSKKTQWLAVERSFLAGRAAAAALNHALSDAPSDARTAPAADKGCRQ